MGNTSRSDSCLIYWKHNKFVLQKFCTHDGRYLFFTEGFIFRISEFNSVILCQILYISHNGHHFFINRHRVPLHKLFPQSPYPRSAGIPPSAHPEPMHRRGILCNILGRQILPHTHCSGTFCSSRSLDSLYSARCRSLNRTSRISSLSYAVRWPALITETAASR